MIRRSRISVRPNVKPTGRAAATSRETPQGTETPADLSNDAGVKAGGQEVVAEVKAASTVPATETNDNAESQSGDVTSQSDLSVTTADVAGQSASTSSLSTRRKRFSVLPNLSKPRSTPASTLTSSKLPKTPVRPDSTPEIPPASTLTSSDVSESPEKHESTQESAPEPLPVSTKSFRSPAPKLPSSSVHNASRASRFPTKAVITTELTPDKDLSTPESAPELPPAALAPSDGKSKRRKPKPVTPSQDNVETPSVRLDEVESQSANQNAAAHPDSCPSEEVHSDPASVSESQNEPVVPDGSDLSSPGKSKKPQQHVPLALRTLNDPVDRLRLARARKLRELLKKEMNKEKKEKHQRPQTGMSERKKTKDHTKMTMRELIYYLPSTNPMKSYTEEEQRAETDFPSSPKAAPAVQTATEQNAAEEEEEERGGEEEEPMLAPRVKVAEDGSLIIDEESLTVQVQRMKGPNPVEERDPIFERGSTTTYSSFRKGTYTKPWSNRETDMFFLAISMVGTDFSMIGQLFPHRARIEIKNKFKKEERANSWRIDKAFKEKRRLDLDFFNKLLEQILKDEEEKRKKKKHASQMAKIPRRRPGERKRKIYSSDSEEDESSSSDAMEGEKENESVCNDAGSSATPKRKRAGASQKRSKHANQSAEQEAEEEAERRANEESSPVHELDSVEEETESFGVKPVRRWRNRGPVVQRKAQDTHTSAREDGAKESASNDSENEEEPDLTAIQENILNKPTRSGRIPKLSQHMIRAAADEEDDEEEEQLPPPPLPPDARPRGSQAKRGRWRAPRRGKSRLLTLRASATEEEEDEEEDYGTNQEEENYSLNAEEENQAFVPMGLRSVTTVQSEVEETMEELDISVNVPDVLGISQNAVCPESSCERALAPMGSVPCEHQLDLLVGVIEFLAPDHMEVSEEAARTLLTIGHSAHVTQTEELSSTGDVIIVEESSSQVHEGVLVETMDQSETRVETCDVVTSDPSSSITLQTDPVSTVSTGDKTLTPTPPQDSASTAEPGSSPESKVLSNEIQPETSNVIVPEPAASKTRRNRLPKPKPNLSRASRTVQKEPAEAVTTTAETINAPVKAHVEAKTVESQTSTAKDFIPKPASQPEPEEQNAEICEERENDRTEGCSSVLSLEKKMEDEVSGKTTCVEDERKEETQQTHNESKSRSSGSECSVKPSQSVRRCRGPKPKPNLVRSVRTTHAVTDIQQNQAAVPDEKQAAAIISTDVQQPDEGAHVIPEPERETPNDPVTEIPDANPEELPRSVCESSTSDEPVFILSLTEVLPTLTEGAGLVTEPLALPATSGLLSEPISAIENATADVGGTGPAGDQVFSQLLPDVLIPVSEEQETENRENETSRGKEEESSSRIRRREHSPLTQNITAPEGPDEPAVEPSASSRKAEENTEENVDLSAKRRKLPERGRRAKLQIKPNPVQRKTCRDLPPSDETRSADASSCEMMLEETEPRQMSLEIVSSLASTEAASSSAVLDKEEAASSSAILDKEPGASSSAILDKEAAASSSAILDKEEAASSSAILDKEPGASSSAILDKEAAASSSAILDKEEAASSSAILNKEPGASSSAILDKEEASSSSAILDKEEAASSSAILDKEEAASSSAILDKEEAASPADILDKEEAASSADILDKEEAASSSAILDKEAASSSDILFKNSKTSTASSPVISPPPVRTETPPPQAASSSSSSASASSQGVVGNIDLPGTDPVEPSASGVGAGSQPVNQITPLASPRPLTRPGRRPKGFLSFMSSTSTQRPSESTRAPQKPAVITSRTERRRAAPSTSAPTPPSAPPPTPPPHVSSHTQAETSSVNPSAAEGDEEPTSVAAYFFNDIFTVVDEQEELD
ncbi:transcription factor TFIIIB component B'' homolog isoform X2 [Pangasianodon hypophthalmus]|uniref:transcription factor TFIIIB component B'' homolog isoform X2 n=1 Tax=Pangasianodon hypophthalmus TaxID=310915 RepID=UPI002308063A|nr:transcription factor TFIIIB component B'' homolog isoform X2 [Pangasianodon hypophthalmus]